MVSKTMEGRQLERFKIRLEIRQHELRQSIHHHLQRERRVEPGPHLLEQSSNRHKAESLLNKISNEQQSLQMVAAALDVSETGASESVCPAIERSREDD